MAMQPPSQPIERKPKKELRRWKYDEETRLIHLIETEDKTYAEAAEILSRSLPAVQQRYSLIRQRDVNATITWTPELDAAVIDGQRRRLSSRQIAWMLKIKGKSQTEVIRRRQKLVSESSPIYRRLVSMHHGQSDKDGSEKEMDALGMAMGGEKYKWMEEEKQGR
jgi:hypothetical protein